MYKVLFMCLNILFGSIKYCSKEYRFIWPYVY